MSDVAHAIVFVIVFAGVLEPPKTARFVWIFYERRRFYARPLVPPPEINCPNKAAGSGDLWVPLCCTSRLRSWGRRPRCDEARSCRKRRMGQSSEARRAPSAGGNAAGPARALNSAAGPSSGLARAASSRRWGPTSRTNASTAAALVSLAACRTATWPNPNPNPNWDAA